MSNRSYTKWLLELWARIHGIPVVKSSRAEAQRTYDDTLKWLQEQDPESFESFIPPAAKRD